VAEPWSQDLAALDGRSRHQLRSIAATRAHVLSAQENTKMRLFKNRPALALLVLLALAGIASGAAYTVNRLFLEIDPEKSAVEIERDVKAQLQSAGVQAEVLADKKSDEELEVRIFSTDHSLPDKLGVTMPSGEEGEVVPQQLRLDVKCELSGEQRTQLTAASTSLGMIDALVGDDADTEKATMIKRELASHGFADVEVTFAADAINVTIKSPPIAK
jgi:hypothetical protein